MQKPESSRTPPGTTARRKGATPVIRTALRLCRRTLPAAFLLLAGCETTTMTTLEENYGAYQEARKFLDVDVTTKEQVQEKYGKPTEVIPYDDGEVWKYQKTETVLMNAYTQTPFGTEGSLLRGFKGYQHTILRTTVLEMFFDHNGILKHYRIYRSAPGGKL
jgi:outer membrane protein assembly factor BamE (lipoprotein component of BamABCDE complex)